MTEQSRAFDDCSLATRSWDCIGRTTSVYGVVKGVTFVFGRQLPTFTLAVDVLVMTEQ